MQAAAGENLKFGWKERAPVSKKIYTTQAVIGRMANAAEMTFKKTVVLAGNPEQVIEG